MPFMGDARGAARQPERMTMAEAADNLIISKLRAMRDDLSEIKARMTNVEQGIATVHQSIAHSAAVIGQVQVSIDRHSARLDRIEQRLSMVDPAV
jgi:uncharacterized coiled-coil protein SlyX